MIQTLGVSSTQQDFCSAWQSLHRKRVYVWQFHWPRSSMGLAICATSRRPAKELDARLTRPGRMDRWLQMLGENAMNCCGKNCKSHCQSSL